MINYSLLSDIQNKDLDSQINIFKTLYFEAVSLNQVAHATIGPEENAVLLLINSSIENRKWINISQIKTIIGNNNLSNTRLGYALKKHNIPKKRGKVLGDNINVHTLFLI